MHAVFVEKVLRVQPEINKLYLLLRASNSDMASQRLQNEVIQSDLFSVLRDKLGEDFDSFISQKVVVVAGDISLENFGLINVNLQNEMLEEIDIIVNFAASTKFHERFDTSMGVNTMGALHVLNFAKNCHKIQLLLHISTAYVCGEPQKGETIILEKPFEMGQTLKGTSKLDIHEEKKLMENKIEELRAKNADEKTVKYGMKDYGIERANLYGWPNTYVFTKAMGEMLVVHHKDNMPLIIIRPTMITSTYKDPFPGWIEGLRTIDSHIGSYGQGKVSCFTGHPHTILDTIPVDMVINCVITAIVTHSNQASKNFIYHVSSSSRNPMRIMHVLDLSYRYFTKTPFMNKRGKPVIISKGVLLRSMDAFNKYITIRYVLPLKVLNLGNKLFCMFFQDLYDNSHQKIRIVKLMAKLYKPYVFFEAVFDDTNTEKLRMETKVDSNMEVGVLDFDPTSIDWTEYMMNVHIPGLVKYAMK
ncbi:putative alcohol-forming fatty acyl-CoA reductase [Lupinus albus]|uniref:Fatty acyl-CoA reductase n=2 Tax=Lupinus albus TaxID=3870 RepID=A0A6A4NT29_LUPAL|nr:putative alcohol-forming fatty acyl-CoA reductase [Lupinus albus]